MALWLYGHLYSSVAELHTSPMVCQCIFHGLLAGVEVKAEIIGGDPLNSRMSVVELCVSVLEQISFLLKADTMQLMIFSG